MKKNNNKVTNETEIKTMNETESQFLDSIDTAINNLSKSLSDSPLSLKENLDYMHGFMNGFCQARGWMESPQRANIARKIETTLRIKTWQYWKQYKD